MKSTTKCSSSALPHLLHLNSNFRKHIKHVLGYSKRRLTIVQQLEMEWFSLPIEKVWDFSEQNEIFN